MSDRKESGLKDPAAGLSAATLPIATGAAYETESWGWLLDERHRGQVGIVNAPSSLMTFLKKLSPHNQIVASDMLEEFGLTSDIAVNGQQAEDSVEDRVNTGKPYDLVLMDVQIPVRRGYETTEEIRHQSHSHLKICGLSANAMRSDFSKRLQHAKDDYVTKPIA